MSVELVSLVTLFFINCWPGVAARCDGQTVSQLRADRIVRKLQSPNYPRKYPKNTHCQWLIVAPKGHKVKLESVIVDLETSEGCIYDSVTVSNGDSIKRMGQSQRYCTTFDSFTTNGQYLWIDFKSDNNVEGKGLDLRYSALSPFTTVRSNRVTTEAPKNKGSSLNMKALIGGLVGGVCFVIIAGILCGRCLGKGTPHQAPNHRPANYYHTHRPMSTTPQHTSADAAAISAAVHMVQNNNALFMLSQTVGSNISPTRFSSQISSGSGRTNMAFDLETRADTSSAAAFSAVNAAATVPIGIPPPTYSDSMLMTHPPAIPPSPSHQPMSSNPATSPGAFGLAQPQSLVEHAEGISSVPSDPSAPPAGLQESEGTPQQSVPAPSAEVSSTTLAGYSPQGVDEDSLQTSAIATSLSCPVDGGECNNEGLQVNDNRLESVLVPTESSTAARAPAAILVTVTQPPVVTPDMATPQSAATPDMATPQSVATPDMATPQSVATPDMATPQSVATPDMATPQSVVTPDMATPQSVATPDMATPQSVATPDMATPQSAATPDMATPQSAATPDMATPQSVATPDMATPQSVATPDMATPQSAATPDMATPQSVATPDMATPQSVATPDMATPQSVVTPDMATPQSVVTPDMATPQSAATPDMATPQSVVTPDMATPQSVATPDMATPQSVATPDMATPQTVATPDMATPQTVATPDMATPQSVATPDMATLQTVATPDMGTPQTVAISEKDQQCLRAESAQGETSTQADNTDLREGVTTSTDTLQECNGESRKVFQPKPCTSKDTGIDTEDAEKIYPAIAGTRTEQMNDLMSKTTTSSPNVDKIEDSNALFRCDECHQHPPTVSAAKDSYSDEAKKIVEKPELLPTEDHDACKLIAQASDYGSVPNENLSCPGRTAEAFSSNPDLQSASVPGMNKVSGEVSLDPPSTSDSFDILTLATASLDHQHVQRTTSDVSLPPPPSPHPSATGFDSDCESFPPPPSLPIADSGDDLPSVLGSALLEPDSQQCLSSNSHSPRNVAVVPTDEPSHEALSTNIAMIQKSVQHEILSSQFPPAEDPVLKTAYFDIISPPNPDGQQETIFTDCRADDDSVHHMEFSPTFSTPESLAKQTADSRDFLTPENRVSPTTDSCTPSIGVHDTSFTYDSIIPTPDSVCVSVNGSPCSQERKFASKNQEYEDLTVSSLSLQRLPSPFKSSEDALRCPEDAQSEDGLFGVASFASLSSQSSPILMERQLRNSTSYPDIVTPVDATKREALQRADTCK